MISRMKKKLVMLLTVALAILNIGTVYGDGITGNGTGQGQEENPSTLEDVGVIHHYWVNQGFRVYIVDTKGLAVSNTVDFVKYFPWDINTGIAGSEEGNMDKMWNDYYNTVGIRPNLKKDKIMYLGGVKTDPTYIQSPGSINKDGSLPSNHLGVYYMTKEKQTSEDRQYEDRWLTPGKMYTIDYLTQGLKKFMAADGYTWKLDGSKEKFTYKNPLPPYNQVETYQRIMAPIEFVQGKGLLGTGEEMKNLMMMPLADDINKDPTLLITYIISMSLPKSDGIGYIDPNAPLEPLFKFTDPSIKQKYTEIYNKATNDKERKMAIIDTMRGLNLRIAMEPVGWEIPTILPSNNNLPMMYNNKWGYIWTADQIYYGTPTNIAWYVADKFSQDMVDGYTNGNNGFKNLTQKPPLIANNYKIGAKFLRENNVKIGWQWGLPPQAYMLIEDSLGTKKYSPSAFGTDDLASLVENMSRSGYGIMYFGVDLDQPVNTPTWDSIRFPEDHYKPGVPPSMDHIKTEGSDYQQAVYPDGKKKDHNFSITKFYCRENPDGTYTYQSNYTRTNTLHTITLNDEPGYKVGSYFTSPELKLPDTADTSYDDYKATLPKGDFTGDSAGNITVPASSNDRALYMKLISTKPVDEPDTVPIPLWEYEISKQIPERAITVESHRKVTNTLPALPNDVYESDYKAQYKPEGKNGWKNWYNYTNPGIDNAPTNLIAVPAPFEKSYTGLNSGYKVPSRGHTKEVTNTMDSKFCIWRGMDMPTLASYKAEDTANNKSELKTLGLPEGKTPQSTRGETNQPTDISGIIENKLTSQFILNEADSNTAVSSEERTRYREEYEDDEGHTHHRWGSWSAWSHYSTEQGTKNNPTLQDYNIRVHYYLGKENSGIEQAKDLKEINEGILTRNLDGTDENRIFTGRGTAIPTKEAIKLYPYSKMVYNTSHDTTFKPVYTLSQYESTIHNTDYVDMVYSKQYKNSLALNSDQWSTHARSINGIGPNVVLPGGALNTLSTPIKNNTCVAVKVYQTVTPDSMEPALTSGYDYYNPAAAKARRDNLINQVQSSLDGLNVVQYVKRGITDDVFDISSNGIKLDSNGGQQVYNNVTSTDDKYYYKKGLTAANGAKINMLKSDDINEKVYSISSFTDGTVEIKRDGGLIMKLEKKEGIDKINSAQELRELDIRTKFFTNFLTAIDRNAGSKGWYNEAIDSMELHVYTQIFTLGFAKPFDVRTSVLDPKLVGYQESKSDLYNFTDPSKVRSSVYLTEYDGLRDTVGWPILATWGDENNQITMQNVPLLFQSKVFYIPNATVMDTY